MGNSTDISAARIEEINNHHKQFEKLVKKGAMTAFKIGKMLQDIWDRLDGHDSWPVWCESNLVFDVSTANRYLRIYDNYKDNPKQLSGQSISSVLQILSASKKESQGPVEYGNPDNQLEFPWEYAFEKPPLSKAKLNNYRFEIPGNHDVYLIKRGFNAPIKIVDLLLSDPEENLKTAHKGMMENIQVALETYFQEVERIEALQEAHG
ncbi:MAG: DUF3102 domain-containing protein [Treponema sp.]|jgi:hypothetical protein|nr:DUF3102 domain-containing protein [Treponema sp.]